MSYLDVIVEPSPLEIGGTLLAVAIGALLLCGIVLVTIGFIQSGKKKQSNDETKPSHS